MHKSVEEHEVSRGVVIPDRLVQLVPLRAQVARSAAFVRREHGEVAFYRPINSGAARHGPV